MTRQGVEGLLIASWSIICLAIAGLWLWTSWHHWPGVLLQRATTRGEKLDTATLMRLRDDLFGVEEAIIPGRHLHLPGMVGQLLLLQVDIPAGERQKILNAAESATRRALSRDPADARAWARLAWFIELRRGPPEEILAALTMSRYLSPADPALQAWIAKKWGRASP